VLKPFHLPGNEQRWVAYLEVPEEIVMADVARQQQFLEAAQQRYVTTTIILGIFLSLLGVVTIWLVARKSIRPLNEMTRLVASIAEGEGDLTQRLNISYRDETGKLSRLLNIFIKKLQDMVQQLLPVASDVSSLSADGRKISVETSVQMLKLESLIEDMVLAMNEMAESAEQIAANAERTSQFVQHVNDAATSGAEMVQKKALSFNQDNGRQRAETGELAQQAEAVLSDINQAIAEVTDMTLQIASATEQQNAVCEEVNHNLTEVSRLVHQTSKGAQNLRGVGNQLDQAASRLQQKLSLFKV
jgi:methyl-accepting chemotaxis protein